MNTGANNLPWEQPQTTHNLNDAAANATASGWHPSVLSSLAACLLGGVIGFVFVDMVTPMSAWPDLPEMGAYPSPAVVKLYHDAEYAFHSNNGAVDVGVLGAIVGLLLGLFTVPRRRILSGVAGAIGGGLAGGVAGYLIGMVAARGRIGQAQQLLWMSTLHHFALWAAIAVGAALAISAIHPNVKQTGSAIVSGLVGGLMAALAFNLICTICYPLSNLLLITPKTATERMIWIGCGAIMLGLSFGLGMRSATPKTRPVETNPND